MRVELRFVKVLKEYKLLKRGLEARMAKELSLSRHTIRKLLLNTAANPTLDTLGKVCWWLIDKGVPADILPGALFGFRPARLWKAILNMSKVVFYLGLYEHQPKEELPDEYKTIARDDAAVHSQMIGHISAWPIAATPRARMDTVHVPFHHSPSNEKVCGDWFEKDKARAKTTYEEMLKDPCRKTVILLGSQRVNYLVEYFVAGLFGCVPFTASPGKTCPPFYLGYRKFDRPVPSCFGGRTAPPQGLEEAVPGTYYLKDSVWCHLPWERNVRGSGVVILIREADMIQMAIFGMSGRETSAIGNAIVTQPERFYPDTNAKDSHKEIERGKEVYLYVCKVTFKKAVTGARDAAGNTSDAEHDRVEVIEVDKPGIGGRRRTA